MNDMSNVELLRRAFDTPSTEFEAERLVLEASEVILAEMERTGVSRTDLARALGKSKGHVSQILSGQRNMTLRTLAEVAAALSFRIRLDIETASTRDSDQNLDEVLRGVTTDVDTSARSFRPNITAEFRDHHRDDATVVSMAQWLHRASNRSRPHLTTHHEPHATQDGQVVAVS
ncbi:MAG: helix-turn-helix transcriptional regulator [Acidimicrobiia bacterium]